MNLNKIIQREEGPHLDFKEMIPRDLGKVIASFASCGGGLILIGVSSDHELLGVDPAKIDGLWQHVDEAVQKVHPACICEYQTEEAEGQHIMAIRVKTGDHPLYYYNSAPYIREGTSSRPATPEEVERIVIEFYFMQGLKAVRVELKLISKMVEQQIPVLDMPTEAWGKLIQTIFSSSENNIVDKLADTYGSIMLWNSYGKIISNKIGLHTLNVLQVMDGPIGSFCRQRNENLSALLTNMIKDIDDYLTEA